MDTSKQILLSNSLVKGEIYKIRNKITLKEYVGQTLTHRKNKGKYRPFGSEGRFKDHISEAINNTKKNQCVYLNNSIRKYGQENFEYETIINCEISELDYYEKDSIKKYDTLYPNGYNLTKGGKTTEYIKVKNNHKLNPKKEREGFVKSEETRKKMSISLKKTLSSDAKRTKMSINAFKQHNKSRDNIVKELINSGFSFPEDVDLKNYIKEIKKNGKIINYRVTLNGKRVQFYIGKSSKEEAYIRALKFLEKLNGNNC